MTQLSVPLDATRYGREAVHLQTRLERCIVGQDEAIRRIVNVYQMYRTGLSAPGRPLGNFLFLGPTGSGKTRTVEALAESLVGTARAVIKIDCGEFQHSHEIAKLVGSPPGYLGHRETHPALSQEVLNQYHTEQVKISFVLFDEIEKASDALWNLLLGILDKACLTLGDGRRVDFSCAMIFLTSNLGADAMARLTAPKLGFAPTEPAAAVVSDKMSAVGLEAARRKFTPEFMNRLDHVVVFHPLGENELSRILEIELRLLQDRILGARDGSQFGFTLTDAAKAHLLADGTDARYGARHLRRAIERILVQPIANLVATNQVQAGDWICVDFDPALRRMIFLRKAEGISGQRLSELAGWPANGAVAA